LTRDAVFAFGRRCHPDNHLELSKQKLEELAQSPLCVKIEKSMERVVMDDNVASGVRNAALETLATAWPKLALPKAKKLVKHKDSWLAETAQNVVKLLGDKEK
jgi:hypothetical protein